MFIEFANEIINLNYVCRFIKKIYLERDEEKKLYVDGHGIICFLLVGNKIIELDQYYEGLDETDRNKDFEKLMITLITKKD